MNIQFKYTKAIFAMLKILKKHFCTQEQVVKICLFYSSVVITVRRIVAFSGAETPFVSTSHGDSWDVDVIFNAWTDISLLLAEDTERVIGFAPAKDVSCKK